MAVPESQKDNQAAPNGRGETVWLQSEKRQVFRIIDQQNGTVVCQVPSDEVLRVSRNIEDLAGDNIPKTLDVKS